MTRQYDNKMCTGCGACISICPANALCYQADGYGYFKPSLDQNKCTDCGQCNTVCPLHNKENQNFEDPDCYALMMDDSIRYQASSGGVFPTLASWMLEKGGYVCGAAWNDTFGVDLVIISDSEDLPKLYRSKYVQSYAGDVFSRIKALLIQGKEVLFCACPCQVAGLSGYLGHKFDGLYTIDLICTQAPSQKLFNDYLQESFPDNVIQKYDFRVKDNGWNSDTVRVAFADGSKTVRRRDNDSYQQAYHSRLMTPEHCEHCDFADYPRQGDITIGDFWWIGDQNPKLDDGNGTSAVIVNNTKGEVLLSVLKKKAVKYEQTPLEWLEKNRVTKKISIHPERDRFYRLLKTELFNKAVMLAGHRIYDLSICELPVTTDIKLQMYMHMDSCGGGILDDQYLSLNNEFEALEINGWAIDPTTMQPLKEMFIRIGHLAIKVEYGNSREDIAAWLGNELLHCGFYVSIPKKLIYDEQPCEVSVIMIGTDGTYRLPEMSRRLFYLLPSHEYDVGIYGCWAEPNYGSELTYFALYNVIKELGFNPLMIERPIEAPWHSVNYPLLFRENPYLPYEICPPFANKPEMRDLNNICNTFVVGSDQMWHQQLNRDFGETCFLDFISSNKRIISYATSFGREYWTGSESERGEVSYYLHRFDAISVRERSGVSLCHDLFGVEAEWKLDPIFLCPKQLYDKLADKGTSLFEKPFIGAYILDVDPEKEKALRSVSDMLGLPLDIITDARDPKFDQWTLPVRRIAMIEDWLRIFRDASYIVTDSFHGMCLSLLFEKPFIAIANPKRGIVRFKDYAEFLNIEDHVVDSPEKILENRAVLEQPDYVFITNKIKNETANSLYWLQGALKKTKNSVLLSDFDIIGKKLDKHIRESGVEIQYKISELERQLRSEYDSVGIQISKQSEKLEGILLDNFECLQEQATHAKHDMNERIDMLERESVEQSDLLECKLYKSSQNNAEQIEQIKERLKGLEKSLQTAEAELRKINNSASYQIGRIVTWLPRKILNGIKRLRENGVNNFTE